MIQSELKYLIGGKIVNLKCRVFGGKTGPFPMVLVVRVVRPVATVRFRVELYPEPTREIRPGAHINCVPKLLPTSQHCCTSRVISSSSSHNSSSVPAAAGLLLSLSRSFIRGCMCCCNSVLSQCGGKNCFVCRSAICRCRSMICCAWTHTICTFRMRCAYCATLISIS